ncbi:hypothetical protein G7070_10735 [Propioniciclava coleopterorum]|uniref:Uncharacterized protein n=1 Tax=Propioniciclava coleopterorum TaxID=2714937 RepID=A0A6G7Y7N3_9ACTN|nr:hypothetical protein [Propioniciclava coleopterorum]QIK72658.1 hypothetical protein G7070_10735 [Propioniciclava coleopterorum]
MTGLDLVYRRDDDGVLHYRDAWTTPDAVMRHTGKVGHIGALRPRRTKDAAAAKQALAEFAAESEALGFAPFPEDDRAWVVLQYWAVTPDFSHVQDARIMSDLWDALSGHLLRRGLGDCDGYDVGGHPENPDHARYVKVNWFCPVVDADLGVAAVRGFIRAFHVGSSAVIGVRPTQDADYELAYSPRKSDTGFWI